MKIEFCKPNENCKLNSLAPGEVFEWDFTTYMVIDHRRGHQDNVYAIRLSTMEFRTLNQSTDVKYVGRVMVTL